MKIGIRLHDLAKESYKTIFEKCKAAGFDYIQLVFKKALLDDENNVMLFSKENALKVKPYLENSGLKVSMLGAYFNPVHSNKELVKSNIAYFKEHLKYASLLDANYVGSETGSYNDDKWTYNPKNQTEEGYQESISVFKDLVKTAEEYGSTVLMEPAYGHVMYDVKTLKRAFDEINSDNLKVTIDIYNLLYIGNYKNYKEIFHEALTTFNKDIKVIHLKDFNVVDDSLKQCGLGKGIIDFDYIINEVIKYCPEAVLTFEGVVGEDIPTSLKLIKEIISSKTSC